jgi:ABC-type phosphate transport system auxiliary subunit
MADLLNKINALMRASNHDLDEIESMMTDGYARALSLEAERWRLERRMSELAQDIDGGDMTRLATELSALAKRLDRNAADLAKLRSLLADLRRHAADVRVALKLAV